MVGRVALGRQPPALDRVGEDDASGGRARRRPGGRPSSSAPRSWPPRSRNVASSSRRRARSAAMRVDLGSRSRSSPRVGAQQPLVLLVGHRVDARAQRRPPARAAARAVLDRHAVPAGGLEHRRQAAGGDVGHDAVERLAVEVDDPHDLAELGHHRVGDRLPARALVELGVADQRDLAPADAARRSARRRSGGRARPRSARSRRGRPSRSSSRPGRGPSCATGRTAGRRTGAASSGSARSSRPSRWLIACSTGEACGLTDTRSGASRMREPQRGHERHHRRARGLVAADLHARRGSAARGWRGGRSPSPATARAAARVEDLEVRRAAVGRARSRWLDVRSARVRAWIRRTER